MKVTGIKNHGNNLFSVDSVSGTEESEEKLRLVLRKFLIDSAYVICRCERPLFKEGVRMFIAKIYCPNELFERIELDNFKLMSMSSINHKQPYLEDYLVKTFNFFEHLTFIFLNKKPSDSQARDIINRIVDIEKISSSFNCCIAFKSIEDDVLWWKDKNQ